jgi:hypothetical protein
MKKWALGCGAMIVLLTLLAGGAVAWAFYEEQRERENELRSNVVLLEDGSALVFERFPAKGTGRMQLLVGGQPRWSRVYTGRDGGGARHGAESRDHVAIVWDLFTDSGEAVVEVIRRSDGATIGSLRVGPRRRIRFIGGNVLITWYVANGPDQYEIRSPDLRTVVREGAGGCDVEDLANEARVLVYSSASNAHCPGVVLGPDGVVVEDFELGPWNGSQPWAIAMWPGSDRLLVRTRDGIESVRLEADRGAEPVLSLPTEGAMALTLVGTHGGRALFLAHDGQWRWHDDIGEPPPVRALVVDLEAGRIVHDQRLAPWAYITHRPPSSLPAAVLLDGSPRRDQSYDRQLVMLDARNGTERWRAEPFVDGGRLDLDIHVSRHGSLLIANPNDERSLDEYFETPRDLFVARFDPQTGRLDRVVNVVSPEGLNDARIVAVNDDLIAVGPPRDGGAQSSDHWLLLSTRDLSVVASSLDEGDREAFLVDGREGFLRLVQLPEAAR